ncbi:MAG TPA: hypothetical protein VFA37_03975 [Gaiellaceae bacterium]|nr:hypothetical protein [Gaiellaceae bacterium]
MSTIALDPLIVAARRRTLRRRLLWGSVAVVVAVGLGTFLAVRAPWTTSSSPRTSVGLRNSYVGVACHAGTSCGRIGVAVWLARPADSVVVTLFGRQTRLRYRGVDTVGRVWNGFIHVPPSGYEPDTYGHRLGVVVRRGQATGSTHLSVFLSPGWG